MFFVNLGPSITISETFIFCVHIFYFFFWTFQFIMVNKQTIYTCFVNIALLSHYRETVLEDKPTRFEGPFLFLVEEMLTSIGDICITNITCYPYMYTVDCIVEMLCFLLCWCPGVLLTRMNIH